MRKNSGTDKWNNRSTAKAVRLLHSFRAPRMNWLAALWLLTFAACYEPREGCLDLRATNFDVGADNPCPDDCCEYPLLRLAMEHKMVYTDTSFNLNYNDSTYTDGAGNPFRLADIQFYLSNLRLVRADGSEAAPTDSSEVTIFNPDGLREPGQLSNNFALLNRRIFTLATLGTLITEGRFTAVRFTLGVPEAAGRVVLNSLPTAHPLANPEMYLTPDSGYIFNRLRWFNGADTVAQALRIATPVHLREVELPLNANLLEGFDIRLTLRCDYRRWFANVNLRNDPPAILATKLADNAANSFSVVSVFLEIQ
ncbi:MAG TPA: hypothetical protein PKC76_08720 [Saprospiraceae bacterium]|nr:hypothetical protein [Saprospiraceae bacterium]HMP24201.1 hypothetical protein [Saprospiraceae bacterium]